MMLSGKIRGYESYNFTIRQLLTELAKLDATARNDVIEGLKDFSISGSNAGGGRCSDSCSEGGHGVSGVGVSSGVSGGTVGNGSNGGGASCDNGGGVSDVSGGGGVCGGIIGRGGGGGGGGGGAIDASNFD